MPFTYSAFTKPTTLLVTGLLLGGLMAGCGSRDRSSVREGGTDEKVVEVRETPSEGGTNREAEQLYAELLETYGEDYESCGESVSYTAGICSADGTTGETTKENLNIQLVLDASGSMAELAGGEEKLTIAKESLTDFVAGLPERANVALRVYGHVGSNSDQDMEKSCAGTELVYGFQPLEQDEFSAVISSFEPTGWTAIADSLEQAGKDFDAYDAQTNENVVYLISDGIETCGGDPVAAAQSLNQSEVKTIVNVIGFDVDSDAAQQLRAVAQAGGGEYLEADTREQLYRVFNEKYRSAWDKYNCTYDEQWGAYNSTYDEQWARYNCIYDKAWREYNSMYDEAWERYDNKEIDREIRDFITRYRKAKKTGANRASQSRA